MHRRLSITVLFVAIAIIAGWFVDGYQSSSDRTMRIFEWFVVGGLFVGFPTAQFILGYVSAESWNKGEKGWAVTFGLLITWLFFAHLLDDSFLLSENWVHFGESGIGCITHLFAIVVLPLVAGMLWFKPRT